MSILSTLTRAPAPNNVTSTSGALNTLPDWYTSLTRDMVDRGVQSVARPYEAYGGARVAGFSPLQQAAFGQVQSVAGGYQPFLDQAQGALGRASNVQAPQQWGAGPLAQYMSPYMSGVVDEVARLGNRNFTENIMPSVNQSFVGSGQFGSSRNAEILGRAMRDTQADISGKQAQLLQSGYGQAADIFGADQNRQMQYGTNQLNVAQQAGALGQMQQQLGLGGLQAMLGAGGMQQQQQQQGLDLAYKDWQDQRGYDMNQLNQLKTLMSGMQLPGGTTQVSSAPQGGYGASPLAWLQSILNGLGG